MANCIYIGILINPVINAFWPSSEATSSIGVFPSNKGNPFSIHSGAKSLNIEMIASLISLGMHVSSRSFLNCGDNFSVTPLWYSANPSQCFSLKYEAYLIIPIHPDGESNFIRTVFQWHPDTLSIDLILLCWFVFFNIF